MPKETKANFSYSASQPYEAEATSSHLPYPPHPKKPRKRGGRPRKCRFCDYVGGQSTNTDTHERMIHTFIPRQCCFCEFQHTDPAAISKHKKKVHSDVYQRPKRRDRDPNTYYRKSKGLLNRSQDQEQINPNHVNGDGDAGSASGPGSSSSRTRNRRSSRLSRTQVDGGRRRARVGQDEFLAVDGNPPPISVTARARLGDHSRTPSYEQYSLQTHAELQTQDSYHQLDAPADLDSLGLSLQYQTAAETMFGSLDAVSLSAQDPTTLYPASVSASSGTNYMSESTYYSLETWDAAAFASSTPYQDFQPDFSFRDTPDPTTAAESSFGTSVLAPHNGISLQHEFPSERVFQSLNNIPEFDYPFHREPLQLQPYHSSIDSTLPFLSDPLFDMLVYLNF